MNKAVAIQKQARSLWSIGRTAEAAKLYREAADRTRGFAKNVNEQCAADCESGKAFNGTPVEAW